MKGKLVNVGTQPVFSDGYRVIVGTPPEKRHIRLREMVYRNLGRAPGDWEGDDQVPVELVDVALNEGFVAFVKETESITRTHTLPVVYGQGEYRLPGDMFSWRYDGVLYGSRTKPLKATNTAELAGCVPGWRTHTGAPCAWYAPGGRNIGLYPAPLSTVPTTFRVLGYIIPHTIGGGVLSAVRSSGVVTITTLHAHDLQAGDGVTIIDMDDDGFNGAVAVHSSPTPTAFTCELAGADGSTTGGVVYYTGGLPALMDAAVALESLPEWHWMAPVHWAVAWLCEGHLLDEPTARQRALQARAAYDRHREEYMRECIAA